MTRCVPERVGIAELVVGERCSVVAMGLCWFGIVTVLVLAGLSMSTAGAVAGIGTVLESVWMGVVKTLR